MTLVRLDDLELDDALLAGPAEPLEAALLAEVERTERVGFGEPFEPSEPWRLLQLEGDTAHVGARSAFWDGWVIMRLTRDRRGRWSVAGSAYGVEVEPTRAERSAGLRLEWPSPSLRVTAGQPWGAVPVRLVNGRGERVEELTSPHVFGYLTGPGLPQQDDRVAFTAIGLGLDLEPGEHVVLHVTLAGLRTELVPAGDYVLHAQALELDVLAPPLPVTVRSR